MSLEGLWRWAVYEVYACPFGFLHGLGVKSPACL